MSLRREDAYDAVLWLSFGGPESKEDVVPFLQNVTRGRNIPKERLELVAHQYYLFDGVSSINEQNRAMIEAVREELKSRDLALPIYFGNRNWYPYVEHTVGQMITDGVKKALVFVTSAYSSYSSCRQYRMDIARSIEANADTGSIVLHKVRGFYNHPKFLNSLVELTVKTFRSAGSPRPSTTAFVTTAHSIPLAMASACDYESQLRFVNSYIKKELEQALGNTYRVDHAFQSRSGPPSQPWLEPDVGDKIDELASEGFSEVVVVPIGFISDHQEVRYDLDTLAKERAETAGVNMYRVPTASNSSLFISMVADLIEERLTDHGTRLAVGAALPDFCEEHCCLFSE